MLIGSGLQRRITIAATGSISSVGAGMQLTSVVSGGPVLLSAASNTAISITGSGSTFNGLLVAEGAATFTGSDTTLTCGVIARNIIITGSRATVTSC
jgi:hypothetical protein